MHIILSDKNKSMTVRNGQSYLDSLISGKWESVYIEQAKIKLKRELVQYTKGKGIAPILERFYCMDCNLETIASVSNGWIEGDYWEPIVNCPNCGEECYIKKHTDIYDFLMANMDDIDSIEIFILTE